MLNASEILPVKKDNEYIMLSQTTEPTLQAAEV